MLVPLFRVTFEEGLFLYHDPVNNSHHPCTPYSGIASMTYNILFWSPLADSLVSVDTKATSTTGAVNNIYEQQPHLRCKPNLVKRVTRVR